MLGHQVAHERRRRGRGPRTLGGGCGQSTVEYLLVLLAFVSAIVALGLLWHAGRDGVLVGMATTSASHGTGQGAVALLRDVLEY